MKAHLDKAGRVVIPKPIRDQLGIEDNDELLIDTADGRIWIELARKIHILGERKGVLQVTAEWTGETSVDEIIRNEREKRLKRLAGA